MFCILYTLHHIFFPHDIWGIPLQRKQAEKALRLNTRLQLTFSKAKFWIAWTEALGETIHHRRQVVSPCVRRRHFAKKLTEGIGQKLVLEVLKMNQPLEDILSAIQQGNRMLGISARTNIFFLSEICRDDVAEDSAGCKTSSIHYLWLSLFVSLLNV